MKKDKYFCSDCGTLLIFKGTKNWGSQLFPWAKRYNTYDGKESLFDLYQCPNYRWWNLGHDKIIA